MSAVLLVVMPFGGIERPPIGVSTLKAQLLKEGVPCDIAYLNLTFAEAIGYDTYAWLSGNYDFSVLAGEWIFAETLFGHRGADDARYVRDLLLGQAGLTPAQVQDIWRARNLATPFLRTCMSAIDWPRYSVIGFSTSFEQNLSSLSLARRIKDRHPSKVIVLGGANCCAGMGLQLHRSFPWADYVFTGEADFTFPELARRLGAGAATVSDLPGCVHREGGFSYVTPPGPALRDLDALPYPDYDDFFLQLAVSPLVRRTGVLLQIETSRGCWWGAKQHCTFCGLNGDSITFRAKSPERVLAEIEHLWRRYRVRHLAAVDNNLSMQYFTTLLPALKRRRLGVRLCYETRSNLTREQVKLLHDAGVVVIQPGIESLSANTLRLMKKGTRPLRNVELLKWCKESGVGVRWNFLCGVPGEKDEDYRQTLSWVAAMSHLPPADGCGPLFLARFSPYFDSPEQFGIRIRGALPAYQYVYSADREVIDNLAYFFAYDFAGRNHTAGRTIMLQTAVAHWQRLHPYSRVEVVARSQHEVVVRDARPDWGLRLYRFRGPEKTVLEASETEHTFDDIHSRLEARHPGAAPDQEWLRGFLDYLIQHRLMLRDEEHYLSVILANAPAAGGTW